MRQPAPPHSLCPTPAGRAAACPAALTNSTNPAHKAPPPPAAARTRMAQWAAAPRSRAPPAGRMQTTLLALLAAPLAQQVRDEEAGRGLSLPPMAAQRWLGMGATRATRAHAYVHASLFTFLDPLAWHPPPCWLSFDPSYGRPHTYMGRKGGHALPPSPCIMRIMRMPVPLARPPSPAPPASLCSLHPPSTPAPPRRPPPHHARPTRTHMHTGCACQRRAAP